MAFEKKWCHHTPNTRAQKPSEKQENTEDFVHGQRKNEVKIFNFVD